MLLLSYVPAVIWLGHFALEGLALPAFLCAFGALVILMAPTTPVVSAKDSAGAPAWLRRLALANSPKLQRYCGWIMVVLAILIAVGRLTR